MFWLKQKCRIVDFYVFFFFFGLVLLPFNQTQGLVILREYANEYAIYCWIVGGILALIEDFFINKRLIIPTISRPLVLWSLFFVWCLLTYLFNFDDIQVNFFKNRTGNNKFFFQIISIFLTSFFLLYYFNKVFIRMSIQSIFLSIRKILTYVFGVVFVYGILEFLVSQFNSILARKLIDILNYLPLFNKVHFYEGRLSSVSFEVPALGNYLIFIYGWMFSYVFTKGKWYKRYLPSVLVVLLTLLSGARAATVIIIFEALIGWLLYIKIKEVRLNKRVILYVLYSVCAIFMLSYGKLQSISNSKLEFVNMESSISNKTRFGMQYASLTVFMEYPLTGVGLGQNGFHKQEYYPEWAVKDNYEFADWYLNENVYSFPPDFNLYVRLLAETGIIGFMLFLILLGYLLKSTYSLLSSTEFKIKVFGVILFLSFIGFIINWLQIDFFRQFGFWICIVLLVKINSFRLDEK